MTRSPKFGIFWVLGTQFPIFQYREHRRQERTGVHEFISATVTSRFSIIVCSLWPRALTGLWPALSTEEMLLDIAASAKRQLTNLQVHHHPAPCALHPAPCIAILDVWTNRTDLDGAYAATGFLHIVVYRIKVQGDIWGTQYTPTQIHSTE